MTSWPSPTDGPTGSAFPGMRLGNRYVLGEHLASGGMAQVWTATDTVLDRTVAAKVLHAHLATDAAFVQRFRREAVAAARLSHRSIVSIYDTVSTSGVEAIVMELIDGRTLRAELDERGPLDPGQIADVGAQIASALDAAHRAGIVHRDIKPANIMLCDDGRVFVADFGIAKAGTDADLTTTGTLLGTAKYLSPEQVEGDVVDPRSDLYSLGIVLFEGLTGHAPFRANTDAATALARLHQPPPRVRQLRADVPLGLEEVVGRLMARRPDDRYPRASAVVDALEALGPMDGSGRPPGLRAGRITLADGSGTGGDSPSATGPGGSGTSGGTGVEPPDGNEARRPVEDVATQHYPAPGTWLSGGGPGGHHDERPSTGGIGQRGEAAPLGTNAPATSGRPRPPDPPTHGAGGGHRQPATQPTHDPSGSTPFGGSPLHDGPAGSPGGEVRNGPGDAPVGVVRRRRSRLGPVLGALVATVLLVGGVVRVLDRSGEEENPLDLDGPGLTIATARSFDPESLDADKLEREDLVPFAFDGDPATAWQTEIYRRPALAGLKSGVGLQLELARTVPLNRIELDTRGEGWVAEIYVGEGFEGGGDWGEPVVTIEDGSGRVVRDLERAEGRIVLLWLRDPGVTDGRYRFALSEVVLR